MEKALEKTIMARLREQGFTVYHAECLERGAPDILALDTREGGFLWCEVKALGGGYRPEQIAWHREHKARNVFRLEEKDNGFLLASNGRDMHFESLDGVVGAMLLSYRGAFR